MVAKIPPVRNTTAVPMTEVPVARSFARFVTGLSLDAVPEVVVTQAVRLALDTIGNALAAVPEDFGVSVVTAVERLGGPSESTVIGRGAKVSAANAALANGTLAHGLDFDDTREDAIVHTGSVCVPAALAVGEALHASGRQVLEAIIAAVEVMCRVGLAVPGRFHARHYHPTALAGSFAAAAAAGKLFGLAEDQLVHAFGISGSQASGIIEYLTDGSWTKRVHPGWAAHAGITAAVLAESGFTGPETVFEGAHGFYQAFAGGYDDARLSALVASLGRRWEIQALTFKPYPCGSIAHPYMDCALRLRDRHKLQADDIMEIRCRTAEGPVPRLWEPLAAKHAPPNGYAAKFSLPYLIALMIVNGRAGIADFSDRAVRDERVLGLARRVSYEIDPTIDYPRRFIGDVRARLADGRVIVERQEHSRGGPGDPMSREELEAKFRGNAAVVLADEQIERVVDGVTELSALPSLEPLMNRLGRSVGASG
jgi:2-methylcitrate dehydratase PrpD